MTRLAHGLDRMLAISLVLVLVGSVFAFGGAVWWARPVLTLLVTLMSVALLVRAGISGRVTLLRSPWTALGLAALGLALVQLAPLPAGLAAQVSFRARAAYERAAITTGADPEAAPPGRSPATVDRSATLRWMAGAAVCLALFSITAHYVDRVGRLRLVWGSIVTAFGLCTALGVVQLMSGGEGLYGVLKPGGGPGWAPTLADALDAPGSSLLRPVAMADGTVGVAVVPRPRPVQAIGPMMGGPGAYLALAALALPLALALALQTLAPRGSREPLRSRLRHEGGAARLVLLVAVLVGGSALAGAVGGPWLAAPIAVALGLTGLPAMIGSGLKWSAPGLTLLAVLALGAGTRLTPALGTLEGASPLSGPDGRVAMTRVWYDAARMARDFPLVGTGLGSFPAIYPQYKQQDPSLTTAWSTLMRWWVEAGWAGLGLLGLALVWALIRLPGSIQEVGSADRALAFGLIGATVGLGLFSTVHWTVELPAIALAASAVAGTLNRWLAGGTDLFVEGA